MAEAPPLDPTATDSIPISVSGQERVSQASGAGKNKRGSQASVTSLGSNQSSLSAWSNSLGNNFGLQSKEVVNVVQAKLEDIYIVRQASLATGQYTVVNTLVHKGTKEKRAAKTMPRSRVRDLQLFQSQLDIAFRVRHPQIVRLWEVFETEDSVHMVMEKCSGGNLHDKIFFTSSMRNSGLPVSTVVPLVVQMLRSIAYLHHFRIAHRDIKPRHFLLVDSLKDDLKLIDFTSACIFRKDGTVRGRAGSTPIFAPEMLGDTYTCKCDVWAVGVVSYMLITRRYPLHAETHEAYEAKLRAGPEGISYQGQSFEALDAEGVTLVQQMLRWEAEDRPPAKKLLQNRWLRRGGKPPKCCDVQ